MAAPRTSFRLSAWAFAVVMLLLGGSAIAAAPSEPGTVTAQSSPGPFSYIASVRKLRKAFADNGLKSIVVHVGATPILLTGTVRSAAELKKAEALAKKIGADIDNKITISRKPIR